MSQKEIKMKIEIKTPINRDMLSVFKLFNRDLFTALTPKMIPLQILRYDGQSQGDEIHLIVAGQKWVSVITETRQSENECYFVDEGKVLPFPLVSWRHQHLISKRTDLSCEVIDSIHFSVGNSVLDWALSPFIFSAFKARSPIYKRYLTQKGIK
jgi:ligand-binding SRPBCC domain-containing protein